MNAVDQHDVIEAKSLLGNELLMRLLATISEDAKTELVSLNADDAGAIRDKQALCRAVDEIISRLRIKASAREQGNSVA